MFPLASHHTFSLPSFARDYFCITEPENLPGFFTDTSPNDFIILGEGSNTVFLEDYIGVIVQPHFKGIKYSQNPTHHMLKVGAGENWHELVVWCMNNNIHGLENLALIPGSVGAAPIQNIGAYGIEVERFIDHVDYYDLHNQSFHSLPVDDCVFGYRDSIFKGALAGKVIITHVCFAIPKNWQAVTDYGELKKLKHCKASEIFNKVIEIRQSKLPDPKKIGNAGSFFKNPMIDQEHYEKLLKSWPNIPHFLTATGTFKIPAGWLIEQLGFKGYKLGGIACHAKQALVLTNDGSGTGEQVLTLARDIKAKVFDVFAITLEHEVRLIGKNGPILL